jgi:hypothetical protein
MEVAADLRGSISKIQKSRSMTGTDTLYTGTCSMAPANVPAWAWP